jgi:hypothetical protein
MCALLQLIRTCSGVALDLVETRAYVCSSRGGTVSAISSVNLVRIILILIIIIISISISISILICVC